MGDPPLVIIATNTDRLMAARAVVAGKSRMDPTAFIPRCARLVAAPAHRSHNTGAMPSSLTASSAPHFKQLGIYLLQHIKSKVLFLFLAGAASWSLQELRFY